jgi:hypothetical protein
LLRYQELAVENYGCASECLANERISCVKNLGNFFLRMHRNRAYSEYFNANGRVCNDPAIILGIKKI